MRLCALLGAAAAVLAAPAGALAGQGVFVTVHNKTANTYVNLTSREGSNCWEGQGLNHPVDQNFVSPGQDVTYTSEKKTSGGCKNSDGHQNVQFWIRDGGRWYSPEGSPQSYRLYWQDGSNQNFGLNFYDGLTTWLPREDGYGLICMHAEVKNENFGDVWVWGDRHCNTAWPATVQRSTPIPPSAPNPKPRAGEAPKSTLGEESPADKMAVANVLSAATIACNWYVYASDPKTCSDLDVGNENNWSLENLSTEVANFKVTQAAAGKSEKVAVAAAQNSIPKGKAPGKVSVNESIGISQSNGTSTSQGGKIGLKLGFKQSAKTKLPFFGEGGVEFSQEISGEYNYTKTESETNSKSQSRSVSIDSPAEPGFTTRLEVYTVKGAANYLFEADLKFGDKEGKPQNVTTPVPLALGQSPARRQPCLAYSVGEAGVRNSLVDVGYKMLNAGFKPNDSSKPIELRAFLTSLPYYQNGKKNCQGFPDGYSSSAGFKGKGVGTYANTGYDATGNPVSVMVGCTYVEPFPPAPPGRPSRVDRAAARATAGASPCRETPVKGEIKVASPGVLVDDGDLGGGRGLEGPTSTGTVGSDLMMGPEHGGTVRTGGGAFDVVRAGDGDTRVFATARENLVYGGKGDDLLEGGHGTSFIYAGSGRDRLVVSRGAAAMYGGGGDDLFEGHTMKGVMFGGSGDNKMVGTGNLARLAMSAEGKGDDLYVLRGRGTPSIVQLPGPGTATLLTTQSFRVPANIDVVRAIGPRRVTLRGGEASKLVAGAAGGVLVSGPGPTRLRGRGGPDTIVFDGLNDDVAAGGGGADRFVFTGTPERDRRPPGLAYPRGRGAAVASDFDPAQGDRLVLRASVFGGEVQRLASHFALVATKRPRPRRGVPTLLFDTGSGLLSFDRDGTGPISDKVVVDLPGRKPPRRSWFEFKRG